MIHMKEKIQCTILVVDDIPANLKLLLTYLSNLDFKVLLATDGEDGLEKAHYAKPDIILLDIMMPHMDGFETCRQLKANPETSEIPVLFMTALSDIEVKLKGFQIGAVDYITKPIQHEEVLMRIKTHLMIRNLQRITEQRNHELAMITETLARDIKIPLLFAEVFGQRIQSQLSAQPDVASDFARLREACAQTQNSVEAMLLLVNARTDGKGQLEAVDMSAALRRAGARLAAFDGEFLAIVGDPWPNTSCIAAWAEDIWIELLGVMLKSRQPPVKIIATHQVDGDTVYFYLHSEGTALITVDYAVNLPDKRLDLSMVQRLIERCHGVLTMEYSETGQLSLRLALPHAKDILTRQTVCISYE